jgi:hypothetical protein
MAEAAQQAAGALPTQEVEANAPFLAVDLDTAERLLSELHWDLQYASDQLCCCRCSAHLTLTCTMCARSCEYLHESPRMHVPCNTEP